MTRWKTSLLPSVVLLAVLLGTNYAAALPGEAALRDGDSVRIGSGVEPEADWEDVPIPPTDEGLGLPPEFNVPGVVSFATGPGGARSYFPPSPSRPGEVEVLKAAAGTWWDGVCDGNEDQYSIVKQYVRPNRHARQSGNRAKMYCGKEGRYDEQPFAEAAFGIRHIRPNHKDAFAELARMEGESWGHWMHWAIGRTLEYPLRRTVQNTKRYCYEERFDFITPRGSQTQRRVVVILGKTGVRIMTAFPRPNTLYCGGDSF